MADREFSAAQRLARIEDRGGIMYVDPGSRARERLLRALRDAFREGERAGYARGKQDGRAAEVSETVRRMAGRISVGGDRVHESWDPYQGYSASEREFAEQLDLWTLEQVIVRVMTEIDRRRRRHNPVKEQAARHAERVQPAVADSILAQDRGDV